jgi:uncharacterized protein (TIGR03790 family)
VRLAAAALLLPGLPGLALAQGPENVLVIVNRNSEVSGCIAGHYTKRRLIPAAQVCLISAPVEEGIPRTRYEQDVERPVRECLTRPELAGRILYLVTTSGVPLKIGGTSGPAGTAASVDSELCLLYGRMRGTKYVIEGPVRNPFYLQADARFEHPRFPVYLVTRLTAFDFDGVKRIIDLAWQAAGSPVSRDGKVYLDMRGGGGGDGESWLRETVARLPAGRAVLEETEAVVYGQPNAIGYASWGSNDPNRKERRLRFRWLPGALATEFVSTDARTFRRPPETWTIGPWKDTSKWFAGAPQTLTADLIADGATGASGHVDEPYLGYTPRPQILFPAYLSGRNLAESFYLSIPAVSWTNVVVGDPLCRIPAR